MKVCFAVSMLTVSELIRDDTGYAILFHIQSVIQYLKRE